MKQIYTKTILAFCLIFTTFSQAQTYNINTAANPNFGGSCGSNSGIDATYSCGNQSINTPVGSFTDTNSGGLQINGMTITTYIACNGTVELFLNGVSVGNVTVSGTGCSCQSIASTPGITNTLNVTITPAIQAAYVIGGNNTLSLTTESGTQCFYGADVTVTTGTLGVDNFEFNTIKIFPNPASDFITISGLENKDNFRVFDVLGNEILKGAIIDNGEILIKKFPSGLYFLKFDNGNTIKFIKK